MICLNKSTGEIVWEKNLVTDSKVNAVPVQFGFSASPILSEGRVIVFAGGREKGLLCLDIKNGNEIWTADCGEATYATPTITILAGEQQVVVFTKDEIVGIEASKGSIRWHSPLPEKGLTNVPTVLPIGNNRLVVSGQGAKGTYCLEIKKNSDWEATKLWEARRPQFFYCNWIFAKDSETIFGCTETMLMAVSATDGTLRGRWRGFGNGNLLRLDDQFLCVNGKGQFSLLGLLDNGLSEDFRTDLIKGRVWTAPTLFDGKLIVRVGNQLSCFEMAKTGKLKNTLSDSRLLEFRD